MKSLEIAMLSFAQGSLPAMANVEKRISIDSCEQGEERLSDPRPTQETPDFRACYSVTSLSC